MSNQNSRRNVVMILCDQLRPDFLHAYGADFIPTPNLDALAENGVVFDNAITASTVCGPARAAIMTGRFVSDHDGWTNDIPCREGIDYYPERLTDAGYMTAGVGIYDHPPYGLQYHCMVDHLERPENPYAKYLNEKHPGATFGTSGENYQFKYPEEDFYDRWITDRATDFIDSYAQTGKAPDGTAPKEENAPFFLYCGYVCPHMPHFPPKEVCGTVNPADLPDIKIFEREDYVAEVEQYRRAFLNPHETWADARTAVPERMKERLAYCEMIVEIDALVGRIVKSLKDNGVYENTTIIFSSDHGSVEHDYNVISKGPWPYYSQLFVPLIVSNNPRLPAGTHCDALCGNMDIGATILDVAGDTKPFGVARSLLGLADKTIPEREVHMSEFCDSCKTLVDKRFTFTYYPFEMGTCLFDRVNDPDETVNLSGNPEFADVERKFLMHAIDFMVLAKGVRIEAHDMVPKVKAGLEKKDPKYLDHFDIAYPLDSMTEYNRIKDAGLDENYNEFCKDREMKACYGAYWIPRK